MYKFRLNGAKFPGELNEFSRTTRAECVDQWTEISLPWLVCIRSVEGPESVEIKRSPSGMWEPLKWPSDETQLGASPERPAIAAAIRVPRSASKVEVTLDSEVFAMRAFSNRWHLDLNKLIAGQPGFHGFQSYRVINPTSTGEFSALAISRAYGQFGNNFIQLSNTALLCRRFGVTRIYVPKLSQFEVPGLRATIGDVEFVHYQARDEILEPALLGTFFYKGSFGDLLTITASEQQSIVDKHVRPLFGPLRFSEQRPPNHIAIHIRSNDLFNQPNPHPRYPQPPLAFYKLALDHFQTRLAGAHVSLVYQDRANPVIDALEQYLRIRKISFATVSSSLHDDLKTLMEHQTIVFGRGTFGKAVVSLAPYVNCVYFPWTDTDFRFVLRARKISGYVIEDISKRYIAVGEWANTPSQRQLMIDYPADNLTVAPGL